jgi:hypothetical protein
MTPPLLATWLMHRFAVNESIIGDLVERYHRRPSRAWYWRQATFAIVADTGTQLFDHTLVAVRGVAVGAALLGLLGWIVAPLSIAFATSLWNWGVENEVYWVRAWLQGGWPLITIRAGLISLLTAWVVARTHRPHGMPVVVALIAAYFVFHFGQFAWQYAGLAEINRPPFSRVWEMSAYWAVVQSTSMLVGGLLAAKPEAGRPHRSRLPDVS